MADLSEVKKEIISLLNTYPGGIAADLFDRDYERTIGRRIPYGDFGYYGLLEFLQEELGNKIKMENQGMQIMLYPIPTENSAHIIKLVEEQQQKGNNNRQKHTPRMNNNVRTNNTQATPQATTSRQRSPTMPPLVAFKPFRNTNNGSAARQIEQQQLKERLVQNKHRHLMQKQQNASYVRSACNQERRDNRSEQNSKESMASKISEKRSEITARLEKLTMKIEAKKLSNSPQNESQLSGSSEQLKPNKKLVLESPKQSLWDDELDDFDPPKVSTKNKADSNSSGMYYGVSDNEGDSAIALNELLNTKPLLSLNSDEDEENTDIKGVFNEIHAGDVIPVILTEVNSPLKFWVNIEQQQYELQFGVLNTEMQQFYDVNRHSIDLKVTDPDEPNLQYFAAHYHGHWYRVEPLDTKMGESLRVSFIDFGTRDIINISQMRKLPKQFWKVPKAALCCALGNIKPIGKEFTDASADALINLVDGEKMFARILNTDTTKSKATVELILKKTKICVNDEMMRLGHAVPKKVRAKA